MGLHVADAEIPWALHIAAHAYVCALNSLGVAVRVGCWVSGLG